ncbi:MAG: AmmeMemoRadiSam system radical SAM enzyme [Bacteroidales bacterium]|nr:AmmeMemoRadiSam system radical SAM enzyme [Bacteroidales bacterium]
MAGKISKRQFLRKAVAGSCGLGLGLAFAGNGLFGRTSVPLNPAPRHPSPGWKWTTEARYYILTPKGIKCQLCPNNCVLKEGETGECRTKIRDGDKLISISYGNPCAIHIDPIEKKPLYHFLPGSSSFSIATAGCNLACLNCQNWEISQASPYNTRNYDLPPAAAVEQAIAGGCRSIAYTYSDPVAFYEYAYDTAKAAREKNIKNVLVSAGYIHEKPLRELCRYADAANIDLKSFSNEIYEMLNAGTLQPVLDTLVILKEENVWLEITNLVVPSWTDDMDMIREMCQWLVRNGFRDTPLHFSRFHPLYKLTDLPATPLNTLESARKIALEEGIMYVYIGNVPGTQAENTYCPSCKKEVITRKGMKILGNKISGNHCEYCGAAINGVWE